jgi:ATP-binding cassette subfamily C (CFTR/MRP) protein 1
MADAHMLTCAQIAWTVLFIFDMVHLILSTRRAGTQNRAAIPSAVLSVVGALAMLVLSLFEHMRTIRPPLLLNLYLALTVILDIARSRSYSLTPGFETISMVFNTRVAVKLILAIIEARPKVRLLLPVYASCPPEATSGPYKRALFWWLNALLKKGFSESLTVDDLFHLDKHLQSHYLHHLLGSSWDRCKFVPPSSMLCSEIDDTPRIVTRTGPYSLFTTTLGRLKWPILAVVPPRLCLIGFNFCQPFLINRAVTLSQQPVTHESTNVGYGLIGAYVITFVGIAVCSDLARQDGDAEEHTTNNWRRYPRASISIRPSASSP